MDCSSLGRRAVWLVRLELVLRGIPLARAVLLAAGLADRASLIAWRVQPWLKHGNLVVTVLTLDATDSTGQTVYRLAVVA
jgi:hypothetical protein